MKRLIIYDLDGTLVDTSEDLVSAVQHVIAQMGAPAKTAQEIRIGVGRGLSNLMALALGTQDAARIAHGSELFRRRYGAHVADRSRLYPGARELLDWFGERTQAVVTNKPNPFATDLLRLLGVADRFARIIAAEDGYPHKPDPASTLALMREFQVPASGTLLIGDSPVDIETARRAGIEVAVVTQGFSDERDLRAAAPDALVPDLSTLRETARRHGW